MRIVFASGFFVSVPLSVQKPLSTSHGDERDRKGMQGRVKLTCMGYMRLLAPRSVMRRFMVVPTVTVSYCLFHGVLGFCVNVRISLRLFSLVSPSAWHLLIVTDGCTSSDWLPGPMLVCVHLGDVCVLIGSSLMFLVFFFYVLIRKVGHICFIITKSTHSISLETCVNTSTITRLHKKHLPHIPVSSGGCPPKLSDTNIRHASYLISSGKANTAVDVTKTLSAITSQSISTQAIQRYLQNYGLKAMVKQKKPLLSKKHWQACLDFALTHQYWTMEEWKRVVWSYETKINRLGSDGRKWVWKKPGEGLSDRLVQGTQKFGGGSLMVWGCML